LANSAPLNRQANASGRVVNMQPGAQLLAAALDRELFALARNFDESGNQLACGI